MSDPTARRGDNIMALLEAMHKSQRGWFRREIQDFLFVRYRMGIREETLQSIFNQLLDRGIIYGEPKTSGSNVFVYFVNAQALEQLTGVRLPPPEQKSMEKPQQEPKPKRQPKRQSTRKPKHEPTV
ncbi:MAG: hypothetical protein QW146_03755 [Candidatus Bathyarchaeia archaeon]